MPFGGMLSLGLAGLGAGSSLYGLINGSPASHVNVPTPYQFGNMGGADQGAFQGIGGLGQYNTYGQFLPQATGFAQNIANNPYAGGYQGGANTAGQMGMGAGANAFNTGGALESSALGSLPDVSALLNLGFDPQNALYAKLQQQNTDQTNAINSMYGVGSTPYGAGLADQSNQNFNINWQNNLLGRAVQGAQGAGGLMGQAGGAFGQGANLQTGGAQEFLQGAGTPFSTFGGINTAGLQGLGLGGQFGQSASTIPNTQIGDYLSYLGAGTSQAGVGNQAAGLQLNQAQQGYNQNRQTGIDLGNNAWNFQNAWNNAGYGNPFAQMGQRQPQFNTGTTFGGAWG